MLRSGKFELYHEAEGTDTLAVPEYHIRNIRVPVALICGQSDHLCNSCWLQKELPLCRTWSIPHYEHLDCLMCSDIPDKLFPVFQEILSWVPRPQPLHRVEK